MLIFVQGDPHIQTPQHLQTPTLMFDFSPDGQSSQCVGGADSTQALAQLSNRVASSGQCSQLWGLQTQRSTASKYRNTWSAYTLVSNYG